METAARHPDPETRREADALVALLTPVVKAAFTDFGFETAVAAQQVFGGHGYIREWGMEQYVRDARIAQIYEGTNGVQAMDLLGRKVPEDGGRLAKRMFAIVQADLATALQHADPRVQEIAKPVAQAAGLLQKATMGVLARAATDPEEIGAAASEYLRLFGLVTTGWMWMRIATVAAGKQGARYDGKLATARFYATRLLPQVYALAAMIDAGAAPVMALEPAAL